MRVAVIGGTGFVGRAIVRACIEAGHEVCVVHRGITAAPDEPQVEHFYLDRRDYDRLRTALVDCDAVVDAYALTAEDARVAVAAAPNARLVVLSSCDVYRAYVSMMSGRVTDPLPMDEDAPVRIERYPYRGLIDGMDDYDKLDVEDTYVAAGAAVLRLGFVIGPHDAQRREEPILRRIRAGRSQIPIGVANLAASRILVDDVARAVVQVIGAPAQQVRGEVFNLVESASPTLGLWASWIIEDADADVSLAPVADHLLPPDLRLYAHTPQSLLFRADKARDAFGFRPTAAREATRRSVVWHLAHPPADADADFTADDAALAAESAE